MSNKVSAKKQSPKIVRMALIILLTFYSGQTFAVTEGQHLLEWCKTDFDFCLVYMTGVTEMHTRSQFGAYCASNEVTPQQASQIVQNFLKAIPHRLSEPAVLLALEALEQRFPCD